MRLGFLLAGLGEDLTYVAGIGILSFCINNIAILIYFIFKRKEISLLFDQKYRTIIFFGFVFCVFLVYYLPIILQILNSIQVFSKEGFNNIFWWTNPIRLLIPILPKLNILKLSSHSILGDDLESAGAYTLSCLILFSMVWVLFYAKRKILILTPMLLLSLILIVHHPTYFPILSYIAWLQYYRVNARASFALCIIFGFFLLFVPWEALLKKRYFQYLTIFFLLFFAWEVNFAYSQKPRIEIQLTDENWKYFNYIQAFATRSCFRLAFLCFWCRWR